MNLLEIRIIVNLIKWNLYKILADEMKSLYEVNHFASFYLKESTDDKLQY